LNLRRGTGQQVDGAVTQLLRHLGQVLPIVPSHRASRRVKSHGIGVIIVYQTGTAIEYQG